MFSLMQDMHHMVDMRCNDEINYAVNESKLGILYKFVAQSQVKIGERNVIVQDYESKAKDQFGTLKNQKSSKEKFLMRETKILEELDNECRMLEKAIEENELKCSLMKNEFDNEAEEIEAICEKIKGLRKKKAVLQSATRVYFDADSCCIKGFVKSENVKIKPFEFPLESDVMLVSKELEAMLTI